MLVVAHLDGSSANAERYGPKEPKQGSDLARTRGPSQVMCCAIGQGLDSAGRLVAPCRNKAAAVYQVQVGYVVTPVVWIDNRVPGVSSHAAGAKQMHTFRQGSHRERPSLLCTRCLEQFQFAILQELHCFNVIVMTLISNA